MVSIKIQNIRPDGIPERIFEEKKACTRTSDGDNGNHSVSLPIILIKIKSRSNASIFIYKLTVGLYFMILHLIFYLHKCTALFLG